jgi:hypothetical protein
MNTRFVHLLLIISCIFASSCASTYKTINPSSIDFPQSEKDAIFSYKYNVLKESRNRKLMKKEDKRHMRIIAVKIVNTTDQTLLYGTNYKIFSMNREVRVLDPETAATVVKQTIPSYLWYLLFTPMRFTVTTPDRTSVTPIGLVLGPALAGGNMAVAANSNKKFRKELIASSIIERPIRPGETFYGLIAIQDNQFMPLTLNLAAR